MDPNIYMRCRNNRYPITQIPSTSCAIQDHNLTPVCRGLEPGEQSEWVFAAVYEKGKVRSGHHPGQFALVTFPMVMLS